MTFKHTFATIALEQGWWITGGLVLDPLFIELNSNVSATSTPTAATELLELDPVEIPLNITEKSFIKGNPIENY